MWAELAELPGCFVHGDSLNELGDGLARTINAQLPPPDPAVANIKVTNWSPVGALELSGARASSSEWTVELSLEG